MKLLEIIGGGPGPTGPKSCYGPESMDPAMEPAKQKSMLFPSRNSESDTLFSGTFLYGKIYEYLPPGQDGAVNARIKDQMEETRRVYKKIPLVRTYKFRKSACNPGKNIWNKWMFLLIISVLLFFIFQPPCLPSKRCWSASWKLRDVYATLYRG